jgi:restriction system protein
LLGLWIGLLTLGFAFSDENRDEAGAAILANVVVVSIGLALVLAWPIDKWMDRRSERAARNLPPPATTVPVPKSAPPAASPVAPAGSTPAWPATGPAAQAVLHDVSALEETAHVHLPEQPTSPTPYKPLILGDLLAMTPTEFEQLCVRALLILGYDQMKRTGGAGDLAADITGKDAQGRSVIVQCKRYAPGSAVGSPVIQTFIGMKAVHHKADRGIVMTTAEFSKPAIALAQQHDIILIDGDDIVKLLNLMGAR